MTNRFLEKAGRDKDYKKAEDTATVTEDTTATEGTTDTATEEDTAATNIE